MTPPEPSGQITLDQVVAYNLRQARQLRGWTQAEAAERLEPYLGERWSIAVFSAAERSFAGARIREFTASQVMAFSLGFDLPLTWFYVPPTWDARVCPRGSESSVSGVELVELILPTFGPNLAKPEHTRALRERLREIGPRDGLPVPEVLEEPLSAGQVVADRTRTLMALKGWRAPDLSAALQVLGVDWTWTIVADVEAGHKVDVSVTELIALACAFNVSPLALLFPTDPAAYAITPNTVAEVTFSVYDWVVGRTGLPTSPQKPSIGYAGSPAGLPSYLEARERVLLGEHQRQVTGLIAEVGRLKGELEAKPIEDSIALAQAVARLELQLQASERKAAESARRADAAEEAKERQAKLFRDLAMNASASIRQEVLTIITTAHLQAESERYGMEGGAQVGEGTNPEDRP